MNTDFIINSIVTFVPIIFGIILFILIAREIICYYFKINKIVALLERIEENTRPKGLVREPLEKSENLV